MPIPPYLSLTTNTCIQVCGLLMKKPPGSLATLPQSHGKSFSRAYRLPTEILPLEVLLNQQQQGVKLPWGHTVVLLKVLHVPIAHLFHLEKNKAKENSNYWSLATSMAENRRVGQWDLRNTVIVGSAAVGPAWTCSLT